MPDMIREPALHLIRGRNRFAQGKRVKTNNESSFLMLRPKPRDNQRKRGA